MSSYGVRLLRAVRHVLERPLAIKPGDVPASKSNGGFDGRFGTPRGWRQRSPFYRYFSFRFIALSSFELAARYGWPLHFCIINTN